MSSRSNPDQTGAVTAKNSKICKSVKFRVHESNDWICHYCGKQLSRLLRSYKRTGYRYDFADGRLQQIFLFLEPDAECPTSMFAFIDHKIPFSKGGSNKLENLTTACWDCNSQKKDRHTEQEFLDFKKDQRCTRQKSITAESRD